MGESQYTLFQPEFNRSLRVEARPERLTSDAGALLLRELMDRSGLSGLLSEHVVDRRDGCRITYPLLDLLRTRLLLDAQGYPDQLDADLLRHDPVLRFSVSSRRGLRPLTGAGPREPIGLASQPTLSRLQARLGEAENLQGLDTVLFGSATCLSPGRAHRRERTLDLDSLPIEVHGHQPGSAYNGHYRCRCYHALVLRDEEGFYLGAQLREGSAHTADGALDFALPILDEELAGSERLWLRIDAGFPGPEFLAGLEARPSMRYVARLRSNVRLERLAAPFLRRPPGRPPVEGRIWFHELLYRARSWEKPRRVVLVVLERPGEQQHLFLDHFFLVTNASAEEESAEALLRRYRGRGGAEKDFGAWQNALTLHLSSTPRPKTHYRGERVRTDYEVPDSFRANEARLLLSLVAANLMHAAALLLARRKTTCWSRERFRALVLKAAGRVLAGGRRITVVIAAERAPLWNALWQELVQLHPARGSPALQALPTLA
ncbi:MAG TPA: IS1380 family transposase [Longimicrobiales bacterium]